MESSATVLLCEQTNSQLKVPQKPLTTNSCCSSPEVNKQHYKHQLHHHQEYINSGGTLEGCDFAINRSCANHAVNPSILMSDGIVTTEVNNGLVNGNQYKMQHLSAANSNSSSGRSSPSKVCSVSLGFCGNTSYQCLQQQQQHMTTIMQQYQNGSGISGVSGHQNQPTQPHPAIINLKQCSNQNYNSCLGTGMGSNNCLNITGTVTPPLYHHHHHHHHHHPLYANLILNANYASSASNSVVGSPAPGRRKRYTSASSNCSTNQFNNNYAGIDADSLDETLHKVCIEFSIT